MRKLLAAVFALFAFAAHAQTLQNLPPNSVVGRLGAGTPGPAQAIPFIQFGAALAPFVGGGGGSAGINIYRNQIPTVTVGVNQTIIVNGYRRAGDRGFGAIYTSVGATSTGWEAIQDAGGNWFNLVNNVPGFIDGYSNRGEINVGYFGAYGDNGGETITSADITANPAWRGTYTAGMTWDYVATQEAIYAAFANQSTPGHVVWNQQFNTFNSVLYVPPGQYTIANTLFSEMQGFTIRFASRGFGTEYEWIGTSPGIMWDFQSASYGLLENFSNVCNGYSAVNAPFTGIANVVPCVRFDHNASPGGLKTQQLTLVNPYTVVGFNGGGISVNPVSSSTGQGDTIAIINGYFAGDFQTSVYGLQLTGDNTLEMTLTNGDFQGFPVMGINNAGGNIFVYGTHFENEIFNGNAQTPILNQINTSGADLRNDGSVSSVNASRMDSVRSEAEIISQATNGGFTDIFSSTTTGSDVGAWVASTAYMAGQIIHGGTKQRMFMVVDNGGACSQWCAVTSGFGTNVITDSAASYTTNQWVGFTAWLRNPTNSNTFPCPITANTATTITYNNSICGVLGSGQTQYQIGGKSGSSAPSWDSAANGYSGLNDFDTAAGSTCVGVDSSIFGSITNGDYLMLPYGDQLTQAVTGALTFQMPLYAKITATASSSCAGSSLADQVTINKKAGVSFTHNVSIMGYGATPVTDNNISWIELSMAAARGFNNIAGLSVAYGFLGKPYGVATNFSQFENDYAFDPNGNPFQEPASANNIQHNAVNGTTENWACVPGTTSGTIDLTLCLANSTIVRLIPTGAVTLTAPKTGNLDQTMTLLLVGNGSTSQAVSFTTNFAASGPVQVPAVGNIVVQFLANAVSPIGTGVWIETSRSGGVATAPFLYSAAGTALPSCVAANKGAYAVVSDATGPTYNGTYTSGGAVLASVICNGSNWVTQ